ncbi:MAG TPA: hypothetical protein VI815_00630 [Candidatus Nanoarchaeia archaeon]|nr:hypothetical protein [Candidatus Nanoarchaeia archaeon]
MKSSPAYQEKNKNSFTQIIKKSWNYLWNGDSLLSWALFMVIVFLIIKFIFFPMLSFVTGTNLPIVIVESCSMHHNPADLEKWWSENKDWYEPRGITQDDFESFPINTGFTKGDIFFVVGAKKTNIEVGDTIIFSSGISNRPIIHRIVGLDPISTKGDNNALQFTSTNNPEKIDEINISESQIIGKATSFRIPFLGWIKLIFYEPFRSPGERGLCE